MPTFSITSQAKLRTCHPLLQQLLNAVVLQYDCTIIEGYRSHQRQMLLYSEGKTKVTVSKHNTDPSNAIDVAPYIVGRGIPWPKHGTNSYIKDLNQFYHFAGFVEAKAKEMNINIRWGGDWDRDHDLADQHFDDLVHFELGGF